MGLATMRARAEELGGTCLIGEAPGGATQIADRTQPAIRARKAGFGGGDIDATRAGRKGQTQRSKGRPPQVGASAAEAAIPAHEAYPTAGVPPQAR